MNTVLETSSGIITDQRVARCKHPRLRAALTFCPPIKVAQRDFRQEIMEAAQEFCAPEKVCSEFPLHPVAKSVIKVMEFAYSGMRVVFNPF